MQSFYVTFLFLASLAGIVRCQNGAEDKTTQFIKSKLANYDKLIRPHKGERPVEVTVSGYVLDMYDISSKDQTFTVNMYLRHQWKDPRLEFTEQDAGTDKLILGTEYGDKIWKPDSFVVNERESRNHDLLTDNEFIRVSPDGTVLISARYTIKAGCSMSLGWFPFDRHTCSIQLESYAYTAADFVLTWKKNDAGDRRSAVTVSKEVRSIQFTVSAVNAREEEETFSTNTYRRVAVEFFLVRSATRYVHEIYFPAFLLACLSFLTLFHSISPARSRLYLSIALECILIIVMAMSADGMPPVTYQTALDFYLLASLITITTVIIINFAVCLMMSSATSSNGASRLRSSENESQNAEEEGGGKEPLFETGPSLSPRTSRIFTLLVQMRMIVPLAYLAFNVLYWLVVLIGSSFYPEDFLILENRGS